MNVLSIRQSEKRHEELITCAAAGWRRHSHLSLDVVLQQILVHGEQVAAAQVVVVVRHRVVVFLSVRAVLHIVRPVAVVVVIVTWRTDADTVT